MTKADPTKKGYYWPKGAALFAIDLLCNGIPISEHKSHFQARYPGHDFGTKFDDQVTVNCMIGRFIKANPLSDERAEQLATGRTAAKHIPGGSIERIQSHENTKAHHAHISDSSVDFKLKGGKGDKMRRKHLSKEWAGNAHGSGKSQQSKDHLNQLKKENSKRKTQERKQVVADEKEKARKEGV